MTYWLLKTEPETFSWDDQVKRGAKGEPWTGVRNFMARRNLMHMRKGDRAFFYHTGDEKQVVGIVAGRGLGASAGAALTTRGFAELFRFGKAFGARPDTLVGLSGLGDLILTCASPQSRNFSFGLALGKGITPETARASGKLAEGVFTAAALVELAQARAVEMPIAEAVAAVLDGELGIDQAIEKLLTRPFRAEGEDP